MSADLKLLVESACRRPGVLLLLVGSVACIGGSGLAVGEEPSEQPSIERVVDDGDPAKLLAQIRSTVLDAGRAVSLRKIELEMGPAIFAIERGVLIPATTADGRTVELVFIGQASFNIEAPDEIEAGQLELFVGERALDAPIEEAVLVLFDEEALANLLERPPPRELRPELLARAEAIHRRWLEDTERRSAGVEAAIFKSLVGDQAFRHYFALWCRSFEFGDFVYQLDPEDVEQITLATFHPLELTSWQRARLRHHIRVQQRKGRWLDVRVQDLGSWDIWLSTPWTPSEGPPLPGNVGFEAKHYEIDVAIKRRRLRLEGVARLDLEAQTTGRRIVRLELMRDLTVRSVVDDRGRDLFFFRSADEIVVFLPEPSSAGERMSLEVTYEGRALQWVRGKTFDLRDTANWHPHCGSVDRATDDVTLRWPKSLDLVASGRLVDGGREGGSRWERRRLDVPSIAFSFTLGDYIVEKKRVGHVWLTVAFGRGPDHRLTPALRDQAVDTVADALQYFERTFGPYPLDELTVVTVPRQFSQSYLGFVTLAESILQQPDPLGESAIWQRDTTIAHELAHQWWGNLVGWWSYRDQWLSEGMANYSALLYDTYKEGRESNELAILSAGWRDSLSQTTVEGRTIESLGPIVLGNRLNSSRAHNGYRTIVYRKGAVVLAMLARAVGEERFLQMMHSLADAASNRVMTTEGFIKAIEKMSGLDLDGFARQYIYGTGIPEVYYGYDTTREEDGSWKLSGEARLRPTHRYRHEIVRSPGGRWDLRRRPWPKPDLGPTTVVVPYRVTLGADAPNARARPLHRAGQLFLQGRRDGFEIETEREPLEFDLDPMGEILAYFYAADRHPKRVLRYRAADLTTEGRLHEAEARYHEALNVSSGKLDAMDALEPGPVTPRVDGFEEDLKIRLALVRLYMDQDRDESARAELDAIDREIVRSERMKFRMEREALRSRLEVRAGQYASVYKRLKKTLKQATPRPGGSSWRELLLQLQLSSEREAVTEAYNLLAIAAHETDKQEDLQWALQEARSRNSDVTSLARLSGQKVRQKTSTPPRLDPSLLDPTQ